MAHLKFCAPDQLPSHGLTLQQIKPWKNHLKKYLRQAQETAADHLAAIQANNPEAACLHARPNIANTQLQQDLAELLECCNVQLTKFISLITMLCHYTEQDQVNQQATNLDWIFNFLEQKYNLSNRGTNFLKIGNIAFTLGTPYDAFYKELRSAINDSLLKEGDCLLHWDNTVLEEDECFSPALENVVVLWVPQFIDAQLPNHVLKIFGHQLKDNTHLINLQQ